MMDRKLLELLVCPLTQGKLEYDKDRQVLLSPLAKLVYPVRDGIPIMLQEQAMPVTQWEAQGKPHADQMQAAQAVTTPQEGAPPEKEPEPNGS